jgi:peptidoglycan hydrolase-like protein with peptidoglycan-binding domain
MKKTRKPATILASALTLSAIVFAGGALSPNAPAAEASQSTTTCSTYRILNPTPYVHVATDKKGTTTWTYVYPIVPVSSAGSTNCLLKSPNTGAGVTALQNGLAFTDYDLRANPPRYEYARILVGNDYLAANNWGIDSLFGDKTYRALKRFQERNGLANDGQFGNNTRAKSWFGERDLRNGYKWTVFDANSDGASPFTVKPVYAYN